MAVGGLQAARDALIFAHAAWKYYRRRKICFTLQLQSVQAVFSALARGWLSPALFLRPKCV
jgi:hypothetical protein